jgi:hypothetical protein
MLFDETVHAYSENNVKLINTVYEQNAKLLNAEASGTYTYHLALKG